MKKAPTVYALLLINLSVFIGTMTFLPRRGSWFSHGPISSFINSRGRWDIAWGILLASLILSVAVMLILHAKGAFDEKPEASEQDTGESE